MNVTNSFLLRSLKPHKGERIRLLLIETTRAVATIAAAGAGAYAMDGVFLAHKGRMETAPVLLVLFLLMILPPLLTPVRERISQRLSTALRTETRAQLHAQMLTGKAEAAEVRRRILPLAREETDALDLWFSRVLPVLLAIVTKMPIALIAAAIADPVTGLFMFVTMPIAPFLLYLIGRVTRVASEAQWKRMESLAARFGELLRTLPALKIFRQAEAQRKTVEVLSETFSASALRVLQLSFISAFALELITTLAIAIIAVSIGFRLLYGQMDFRVAFFVLLVTPEFYQPLRQAGTAFHSAMTAWTAESNLRAVLSKERMPYAIEYPNLPPDMQPALLEAHGLSFHYPNSRTYLFRDFNLKLEPGVTIVKGPSGCGKSTLIRLLAGLLQPCEGQVTVGTSPLSALSMEAGSFPISYVPQEPHLFAGTLAENVTLFHAADEADVEIAIRHAALGKWLDSLPHGLAARLGEGGQTLSQGQRKRLGIARALLQNRPIVLLDEPTAGLDAVTQETVRDTLFALCTGRTALVVSHDEAICAMANRVIDWEVIA